MVTNPRLALLFALALVVVLAACGGDDSGATDVEPGAPAAGSEAPDNDRSDGEADGQDPTGDDQAGEAEARAERPRGIEVTTSDSQFGEVLFDGRDQAIYFFDLEQASTPECYGSCAAAWPPVLTRGEPRAGGEVRQALLGTAERRDGTTQVTYGGRPLYYYVDEGPGELRCHNIFHEGGLWLAVQPGGEPVPHDPDETISLD